MKVGGENIILEKNRSRRGIEKSRERKNVEYFAIGRKVTTAFIIIFGMCSRKGI
jgi:hypothetical protein